MTPKCWSKNAHDIDDGGQHERSDDDGKNAHDQRYGHENGNAHGLLLCSQISGLTHFSRISAQCLCDAGAEHIGLNHQSNEGAYARDIATIRHGAQRLGAAPTGAQFLRQPAKLLCDARIGIHRFLRRRE